MPLQPSAVNLCIKKDYSFSIIFEAANLACITIFFIRRLCFFFQNNFLNFFNSILYYSNSKTALRFYLIHRKTYNNPYGQTIESTNNLIKLGLNDRPALNEYFGSIFFYKEQIKVLFNSSLTS